MSSEMTQEDLDLIANYPESDVKKIKRGVSGMYDEFGVPKIMANASTRKRLAKIRKLVSEGKSRNEIADALDMSRTALDRLANRWGGLGTDGT